MNIGRPRSYTEEQRQKVISLRLQGLSKEEIAAKVGVTLGTAQRIIADAKVRIPKELQKKHVGCPKYTPEQYQLAIELRKQGLSLKDISDKTGIREGALRRKLAIEDVHLTPEQISRVMSDDPALDDKVVALRLSGETRKAIAIKLSITQMRVKNILLKKHIRLSPEVTQQHAYEAKVASDLDAMANMRAAKTPESYERQRQAAIKIWSDPAKRAEQASRSASWWANMSASDKEEYLTSMGQATDTSQLVQDYRTSLRHRTSDKNAKTISVLKAAGVSSSAELMNIYAAANKGVYVGGFNGSSGKCDWKCERGHCFSMRPNNVTQGQWCPSCSHIGPSVGQLDMATFCHSLGLSVSVGRRDIVPPMELDVYIDNMRVGIEYNGLYWHSSAVEDVRGRHLRKGTLCLDRDVSLLAIFEDEWDNKRPLVEEMIRIRTHTFSGESLDARKLEVVHFDRNADFSAFLNAYHLDGHAKASEAWGLVHQGQLVMVASVRTNFNGELEIARLATAIGYRVRGGAGKLISKMPRPLISFSNNRLSSGGVYKALGFRHLASLGSSYWYTDLKTRVWRFKCKRDNRPDVLAEYPTEASQALGGVFSERLFGDRRPLYRIEDYGHQKWILT